VNHKEPVGWQAADVVINQAETPQGFDGGKREKIRQLHKQIVVQHEGGEVWQSVFQVGSNPVDSIVAQEERAEPQQQGKVFQLLDVIIRQVNDIKLVLNQEQIKQQSPQIIHPRAKGKLRKMTLAVRQREKKGEKGLPLWHRDSQLSGSCSLKRRRRRRRRDNMRKGNHLQKER